MIAADLDGTLFTSSKEILPETQSALERAAGSGIEIVPTTGRPFHGVSEKVTGLEFVNYILTCNGAAIYNRRTGECLYEQPMSREKGAERSEYFNRRIHQRLFIQGKIADKFHRQPCPFSGHEESCS